MALTLDESLLTAERACLGVVVLDPSRAAAMLDILDAEDFAHPLHRQVWAAIGRLHSDGVEPEVTAVVAAAGTSDSPVERDYLLDCAELAPAAESGEYLANVVLDAAKKRAVGLLGAKMRHLADTPVGAEELLSTVDGELAAVHNRGSRARALPAIDFVSQAFEDLERRSKSGGTLGLRTGYRDLDQVLGGLRGGQLVLIAGRPNVGKSTVGTDILRDVTVEQKVPAALFSLEMGVDEVTYKLLSAQSHHAGTPVLYTRMRDGQLSEDEWDRLARPCSTILSAPLYCDDSVGMTVSQIRAEARRLVRTKGLGLLMIDYLQLMTTPRRLENRQQEVSEMSRGLKLLAKELKIPVVAMCQLNRGPDQRSDKRPQLSDLRESGSLEQDADIVVLLHRPEVSDAEERPGEMDLIIGKHRTGPQGGTVTLSTALLRYGRFADSTGTGYGYGGGGSWVPSGSLGEN